MKVLLVDDHVDTATMMREILALTAKRLCSENHYCMLFIDLNLGAGPTGYELLLQIRAAGCTAPAIALTANAYATDIERTKAAGFIQHLSKPVDIDQLVAIVAKACEM